MGKTSAPHGALRGSQLPSLPLHKLPALGNPVSFPRAWAGQGCPNGIEIGGTRREAMGAEKNALLGCTKDARVLILGPTSFTTRAGEGVSTKTS